MQKYSHKSNKTKWLRNELQKCKQLKRIISDSTKGHKQDLNKRKKTRLIPGSTCSF